MSALELPSCEDVRQDDGSWSATLAFPRAARYFEGHFPGFAVLPGVVQLATARHFAAQWLGRDILLQTVKKMKFTHVVVPDERVQLTLTRRGESEIVYEYRKGDVSCASGVLCF